MSTARSFNGTSDYLTNATAYLSGSGGPFTLMCWMKSSSLTQASRYLLVADNVGTTHQWALIYGFVNDGSGHGKVEFYSPNNAVWRTGSQITILDTLWHHVCYRYGGAGTAYDLFLDGAKTTITTGTATLDAPVTRLTVGAAAIGASNFYTGALAEIAFWSTNLADANIVAIANVNGATLPSDFPTNLLGYWPLGLASPDTDLSSAGNALTVTGTTVVAGPYLSVSSRMLIGVGD